MVPSWGTRNGSCVWPLLTWKPVTLPTALQGLSGQEGSGSPAVWPRITVVCGTLAASLSADELTSGTSAATSRPASSSRLLPFAGVGKTAGENLDIDAAPLVLCT